MRKEYIWYAVQGLGIGGLISYTFYRNLTVFLILIPFGILYPWMKQGELKKKRLERLNLEFKEASSALAGALSAGYSVENAFVVTVKELRVLYGENCLIVQEFSYMQEQIGMNRSVEQVLWEFGQRSGLEDIKNFAEVFSVAKRSGGDLVAILNHTSQVIAQKVQVKEEIRTLTASKQYEQKIMNLMPFLIVFYIDMTSPGFFTIMYGSVIGKAIMTVCLIIYLTSCWIAQRILKIQV